MTENNIVLYSTRTGTVNVNVIYLKETFWLSQKAIALLFACSTDNVSLHLKNIFSSGELVASSVTEDSSATAADGKKYQTKIYNLDAIIAVGYRVNSMQATQFRVWATETLRTYITKGFVLNDEMLKNGKPFGADYFDELLERIREIRASERRIYQKLGDIFEQCSADYSKHADETALFYKIIQNKLHYAITGKTAAELVYDRADAHQIHMGLTHWKNSPEGKILKSDVTIAKNYLAKKELRDLNLLVSAFLDLAEFQARRNQLMNMQDWLDRTQRFLESNSLDVLPNAGAISHEQAVEKAHSEYALFRVEQDKQYVSHLDKEIALLLNNTLNKEAP